MSNVKQKVLAMLVVGGLALPLIVWGTASVGVTELTPRNHSGVHAAIVFMDDGSTLTFSGTATGLDPSGFYVSLVYDNRSVPGGPGAPNGSAGDATPHLFLGNCEPSAEEVITFDQMFLGVWDVDGAGNGELNGVKDDEFYVALSQFRTVSIRFPEPGAAAVVACGVEHHAPH